MAIVFGRESSGLSNDELDLCTHLVHIPTNPAFSSLNVAMAVQVLSYELMLACSLARWRDIRWRGRRVLASNAEMEGFFAHLEQALDDIGFTRRAPLGEADAPLAPAVSTAPPRTSDEVNILRGILSAAQGRKSMRRDRRVPASTVAGDTASALPHR